VLVYAPPDGTIATREPFVSDHRPPALLLLGPTGSGKTPLGELLEARGLAGGRCAHFDFGENLRQAVARNEPDGIVSRADIEFLRHVLQTGALLEDDQFPLAAGILRSFLARRRVDRAAWVVLNGLPRHVGQAVAVSDILDVRALVSLRCSPETVLARIAADTGGDRGGRADDDLVAIGRKLAIFADRTQPLLDFYRGRNAKVIVVDVTATMTTEEMYGRLQAEHLARDALTANRSC